MYGGGGWAAVHGYCLLGRVGLELGGGGAGGSGSSPMRDYESTWRS